MWKMLIERSKGNCKIEYSKVQANEYLGSTLWMASYRFCKTKRKFVNSIAAKFHFQDGFIINHIDDFDICKWSKQALGFKGFLHGWTGFMQNKIQQEAHKSLKSYPEKSGSFNNEIAS